MARKGKGLILFLCLFLGEDGSWEASKQGGLWGLWGSVGRVALWLCLLIMVEGTCRLCSSHRKPTLSNFYQSSFSFSVQSLSGVQNHEESLGYPWASVTQSRPVSARSLFGFSGFWVTPGLPSEISPEGAQACVDLPTSHNNTKSDKWVWKIIVNWDFPQ